MPTARLAVPRAPSIGPKGRLSVLQGYRPGPRWLAWLALVGAVPAVFQLQHIS